VTLQPLFGRSHLKRHDQPLHPDERSLRLLVRAFDTAGVPLTPELIRALGLVVTHWPPTVPPR
jgi:hypothetical protein